MRVFLAGTPGSGVANLSERLAALFALEPRPLTHSNELKDVALPEDLLIAFTGHPDATLLEFLPKHGFKILATVRHPIGALLANAQSDLKTELLDYAASPRTHDLLSLSLEWTCVENTLVIRYEELAHNPASTLNRIVHHIGANPESSTAFSLPDSAPAASDWTRLLSSDDADRIYQIHRGIFAALNYPRPATQPRNQELATELEETRARQAAILPIFQQATTSYTHLSDEISRLNHLLYGARAGQHLYRAWQVLLGNKNYRRPSPTADQHAAPAINPHSVTGYHDLFIDDLHVRFHKAALADNRGTGRVARELFHQLESLSAPTPPQSSPRRLVHFFAAPHWGPENLPPQSCVVIHDVIPMATPRYPAGQLAIFEARCRSVIRQAAKLITISQTSARDISQLLGAPSESLHVIPNGVTRLSANPAVAPVNLPPSPYLVYVGGGDSHKNLEVVFEALSRPAAREVHLVMVGANQRHRATADFFGITKRVHFFGHVEDSVLGYVLQKSTALVFPSIHEGFGLPPLEAAMLGVPSICSRRPAMTELLVDAALFAEPDSPDEWAQRIYALTACPSLRNAVAARALAAVEKLQWSEAARAYVDTFHAMPPP